MVNLSGIGQTVMSGVNKVGANAYGGFKVAKNAASLAKMQAGDTFRMKRYVADAKKYAPKIMEKAKKDFASSKSIKAKTFIALGAAVALAGAGIASLVNKATHKNTPVEQ